MTFNLENSWLTTEGTEDTEKSRRIHL